MPRYYALVKGTPVSSMAPNIRNPWIRSFTVYFLSNALRVGIPFLLLPFLTAYLAPSEYGLLALVQALVLFVLPLVPFNIDAAVGVAYFRCANEDLPSYICSALLVPLATTFLLVATLAIFAEPLSKTIGISASWLIAVPLFGLVQLLPNVVLRLCRARQRPLAYGVFNLALALLQIGLTLLAVIVFGLGWAGRMYGMMVSYLVFSAVAGGVLYRWGYLSGRIRRQHFADATRFCLFLVPHSLGGALMSLGDRFLLLVMVGAEAVGNYAVGFQVGAALLIVGTSVNQAWGPYLFKKLGEADPSSRVRVVRQSYAIAATMVFLFVAFSFAIPLIFSWFIADRFATSERLVMVGAEAVGNYAVGFQVGAALLIVGTSVNQAWGPYLFKKLGEADPSSRVRVVRQSYAIAATMVFLFVAFSFAIPLIFSWFIADRFATSERYAVWIALASLSNGFYALVGQYILYEKKTHLLSALTLGSALLNLVLNYFWIGRWGAPGAAYASAASSFVFLLLSWELAQRVHPMPWLEALKTQPLSGEVRR